MKPVVFGGCFGWFHPAPGARGIVLCSPHAYEELYVHRIWRGLADQLASADLPTLRFDYIGTGNSTGDDEQPGLVRAWIDSIRAAVSWLRDETGVEQVDLVGLRLGATLATVAAQEIDGLEGIALLAPPPNGRAYVRELRAVAMLAPPLDGAPLPRAEGKNDFEAAGFVITAETAADIGKIDLLELRRKPAGRALILQRPDAPLETRLSARLRALGCDAAEETFKGYEQFMRDAHFSKAPEQAFAVLVDWLRAGAPAPKVARVQGRTTIRFTPRDVVEEPVFFGEDRALFGVRCAGPALEPNRPAVLFLNTGSNHHIGSHRMAVTLARRLARQGWLSLRFDIAGIGDSPARPGKPENRLYSKESCADVRAALDWLETQGYRRAVVVGLCSGAYLAFHTALEDPRIVGQVLINAQRFTWCEGDSLEIAMRKNFKSTRYYLANMRKRETWERAISGSVNLTGIGRTLLERGMQRARSKVDEVRDRVLGSESEANEVARGFYRLSDRGVETLLVYSEQDGGLDELDAQLERGARKLAGRANVKIVLVEGADHTLSARWAQEKLAQHLEAFLERPMNVCPPVLAMSSRP